MIEMTAKAWKAFADIETLLMAASMCLPQGPLGHLPLPTESLTMRRGPQQGHPLLGSAMMPEPGLGRNRTYDLRGMPGCHGAYNPNQIPFGKAPERELLLA